MRTPKLLPPFALLIAVTRSGWSDGVRYHALASGSVAASDNPSGAPLDGPARRPATLSEVRPGLLVTYQSPRHASELLGELDLLYVVGGARPSVVARGGWRALFIPGPRSEASVQVDASAGVLAAILSSGPPGDDGSPVLPRAASRTAQLAGSESASWLAAGGRRVRERLFARLATTEGALQDVDTRGSELGGALGLDLDLDRSQQGVSAELGVAYVSLVRDEPTSPQGDGRRDALIVPRGTLAWRREVGRRWSANLDAGILVVRPMSASPERSVDAPVQVEAAMAARSAVLPTFGAELAYREPWGRVTLDAHRAVAPNLLIARNTRTDGVRLAFSLPLSGPEGGSHGREPSLVGAGAAGLERALLIDTITADRRGAFTVARVDLSLAWAPQPGQTFGIRYELAYQRGDRAGAAVAPSFVRNTVYLTFALRYPGDVRVRLPAALTRGPRAGRDDRDVDAPVPADPVERPE